MVSAAAETPRAAQRNEVLDELTFFCIVLRIQTPSPKSASSPFVQLGSTVSTVGGAAAPRACWTRCDKRNGKRVNACCCFPRGS